MLLVIFDSLIRCLSTSIEDLQLEGPGVCSRKQGLITKADKKTLTI